MTAAFSSDGFDLDALPSEGSEDVVLELGGGSTRVETAAAAAAAAEQPTVESESETATTPITKSEDYKTQGNDNFLKGAYLEAYDMYTEAIDACPGLTGKELLTMRDDYEEKRHTEAVNRHRLMDDQRRLMRDKGQRGEPEQAPPPPPFEPPKHEYGTQLAVYHCNRAACLLHLLKYQEAIQDCTVAVLLNPKYTKAWMRRSNAYENTERIEDALEDAKKALESDPANAKIRLDVARLQKLEDARLEKLKEETMGKLKELGNSILGNFGMSLDNFNAVQDPKTGSYSLSFNQDGKK
jgi:tetratricopeptide (TPR) repeat protein